MNSLSTKLVAGFSVLLLFICLVLGGIAVTTSSTALLNQINTTLPVKSADAAIIMEKEIQNMLSIIDTIAKTPNIRSMDFSMQLPILKNETTRLKYIKMGVATPDGILKNSDNTEMNIKNQTYFQLAMAGELHIGEPFSCAIDKCILLPISSPIRDEYGTPIGVLVGFYDIEVISDITNSITFEESGYAFIVDETGTTIAHPNFDLVKNQENFLTKAETDKSLKSLANLIEEMSTRNNSSTEYNINNTVKLAGYAPIENSNWIIAVSIEKSEVLSKLSKLKTILIIAIIILLSFSILLSLLVGRILARPIIEASEYALKISQGDLTSNISPKFLNFKDEIGILTRALDTMLTNLRNMVNNIVIASREVATSSEQLALSSQQVSATMQEVSSATEDVASGMEEVSASSQVISASASEIEYRLQLAAKSSENANNNASEIEARALNIQKQAVTAQEDALEVYENMQVKMKNAIQETKVVEEISSLAGDIANIAEQTNLLALNAAIEAARAGEQGLGFAVVADEVRKLAENSSITVANIQELTSSVQNAINNLINNANELLDFISSDVNNITNFMVAIGKQYREDADILYNLTEENMELLNNIVEAILQINTALESTTHTMEQSSIKTQDIAKGSQVATQATIEITDNVAKLSNNSTSLLELVRLFKL